MFQFIKNGEKKGLKKRRKGMNTRAFYVGETAPLITGSLLRYVAQ